MIIELGVVALVSAVSGMLAARALRRRRAERTDPAADEADAPPATATPAPSTPDPFAGLPARVGDVIQHGDTTRWPECAVLVRSEGQLVCAVLLSREDGVAQATVAMAPPDPCLYWLEEHGLSLPHTPPARLEIEGMLLDRKRMFPVALEAIGREPPDLGNTGRFAIYGGSVGDVAVVLHGSVTRVWYGKRLAPEDFDRLGQGDA